MHTPFNLVKPLLGKSPTDILAHIQDDVCTKESTATLCATGNDWKHIKCHLPGDWLNKSHNRFFYRCKKGEQYLHIVRLKKVKNSR
jgi:hypothetical protein